MLVFLNKKLEETKMERRKQASRLVRRETRGAASTLIPLVAGVAQGTVGWGVRAQVLETFKLTWNSSLASY